MKVFDIKLSIFRHNVIFVDGAEEIEKMDELLNNPVNELTEEEKKQVLQFLN